MNLKINKISINLILNQLKNSSIDIKSLDLSFNNLKDNEIQEILSDYNLESIKELNLSNNLLLMLIKDQFQKLNKLEILDLSYNQLFNIELNAFNGLNNALEVLYLQNNHLTELYPNSLNDLQKCKYINFDSNKINKIRNDTLTSLSNLQTLSFQFNRLNEIESGAFKGLTNPNNIVLHYNNLNSFDKIDLSIGQDYSDKNNYEQYKNINLSNNNFKYFNISRVPDIQNFYTPQGF
jgi:Leucine-rich repeat (LRR) protein